MLEREGARPVELDLSLELLLRLLEVVIWKAFLKKTLSAGAEAQTTANSVSRLSQSQAGCEAQVMS